MQTIRSVIEGKDRKQNGLHILVHDLASKQFKKNILHDSILVSSQIKNIYSTNYCASTSNVRRLKKVSKYYITNGSRTYRVRKFEIPKKKHKFTKEQLKEMLYQRLDTPERGRHLVATQSIQKVKLKRLK